MNRLHYIYDPLCGWCYGAASLARTAAAMTDLPLYLHAGGMLTGRNVRRATEMREFELSNDLRIAELSGQAFGKDYLDGLLNDPDALFDSTPPTAGILAVNLVTDQPLDMLDAIQHALYHDGKCITDKETLSGLAVQVGVDHDLFLAAYGDVQGKATEEHIAETRQLLASVGGRSFPTFILEQDDGYHALEFSHYLGHPEQWHDYLRALLNGTGRATTAIH